MSPTTITATPEIDERTAIEKLEPIKECDASMHLHFLNTLSDIVTVQRQRAYELAIDNQYYNADVHLRACVQLLSRFYYPSFRDEVGYQKWEPYKEFFDIFPKTIPICFGQRAGGVVTLKGMINSCVLTIRDKTGALAVQAQEIAERKAREHASNPKNEEEVQP